MGLINEILKGIDGTIDAVCGTDHYAGTRYCEYSQETEDLIKGVRAELEADEKLEREKYHLTIKEQQELINYPNRARCEECGRIFPKAELRKCKRCWKVLCPSCRETHNCTHEDKKEKVIRANEKYKQDNELLISKKDLETAVDLERSEFGPHDFMAALPYYLKGARKNNANCQFRIAICYVLGQAVQKNDEEAFFWLKRALKNDPTLDADIVREWLFTYYAKKEGVPDFNKIMEAYNNIQSNDRLLKPEDKKRIHDILYMCYYKYGLCCYFGEGVQKDLSLAVQYLTKSMEGDDVETDDVHFHKDISLIGNVQYQFACSCENNDIKSYGGKLQQETLAWYHKAAQNNCAQASLRLGILLEEGTGAVQDFSNAIKYYVHAAELGNSEAQFRLGLCYYNGHGVPQNIIKVKQLLQRAVSQDNENALAFLESHPELRADAPTHITYQAHGDIIQGNQGVIAKDEAIINRANVNETSQPAETQEYKFCMFCGTKLPAEAIFCMKCGNKQ